MSKEKKVPVAAFTKEQRQKMLTSIKETYERKGYTFIRFEEKGWSDSFAYFTVPVGGEKFLEKYKTWIIGFVVVGCVGALLPEPNKQTSPVVQQQQESISYTIYSDKSNPPYNRKVEVILNDRLSVAQLTAIAEAIKASGTDKVDLTFIAYRLSTQSPNSMAWATTHYQPNLEVKIQGLTIEELQAIDKNYKAINYEKVVGTWLYDAGLKYLKVFYIKDGKLFNDDIFDTGKNTEALKLSKSNDGSIHIKTKNSQDDEYYTLDNDGNLLEWSERGNYLTTPPYDKNKVNVQAIAEL